MLAIGIAEMDNESNGNSKEIDRHAEVASNKIRTMDVDENIDFDSRFREMEQNINYYKSKLQLCRDKYERAETEIRNIKWLQCEALFTLNNARMEDENLREHLRNVHLNYEKCAKKSDDQEDLDEMIHVKTHELTALRDTSMEELTQLRKTINDNEKKFDRANAMIVEQKEKNAFLLQELEKKSKANGSIPQDIKERIDAILKNLETKENKDVTGNTMQ